MTDLELINGEDDDAKSAKLRRVSLNHLIPNLVTLASLCAGMSAVRFAFLDRWEPALIAILVAAICDTLDGRLARMLKGTSQFGAELDSLADLVSFGVAPALMVYMWSLQGAGPLGWLAVLAFPCCSALRLARFNTNLGAEPPPFAAGYFTGVPTPAGAGLCLLPLVFSVGLKENQVGTLAEQYWLIIPWMLGVGFLMISNLPTLSLKKIKFQREQAAFVLLGAVLVAALLVTIPWLAIGLLLTGYLVSLPLGYLIYKRAERRAAADNLTSKVV